MTVTVAIGEFARMSHLSVKTLRYYHDIGLLTPAEVDEATGYRRYGIGQVDDALLIRRLRDLDMPLPGVRDVLAATGDSARNAAISTHLARMEAELDRTRQVVASLRALLAQHGDLNVEYRVVPPASVLSVRAEVDQDGIGPWCGEAFGELYARAARNGLAVTGPGGATYAMEFFTERRGEVMAFVPVTAGPGTTVLPRRRFAVALHRGPFSECDRTYSALGSHVAEHDTALDAPIQEIYLVGPDATSDENRQQTEICWPITF